MLRSASCSAAYALDAVVGDECRIVEGHLEQCPRCRVEFDAFRDVAAGLGNSMASLPDGLWLSIESRLNADENEPRPMPRLIGDPAAGDSRASAPVASAGLDSCRLRRRGSVLGAAAAAVALLGFGLVWTNDEASRLQAAPASQPTGVVSALETPGHKVIDLGNGSTRTLAQFVLADGRGYLVSSTLPALRPSKTYQLWGVVDGQPISLGLLGESPSESVFTLAGSSVPSQLRITVEPSGGSVVPSGAVVAAGLV